jgi:hypothetical protein
MRPYLITAKLMRPSNMKRFPTPALAKRRLARPHHRRHHKIVCISCYRSRHYQILIAVFRIALIQSSVVDIGCYIRIRMGYCLLIILCNLI